MNLSRAVAAVVTVFFLSNSALARAQATQPTPPPELRKLDYFAGMWNTKAELLAPSGAVAASLSGSAQGHWVLGGFFLTIDSRQSSAQTSSAGTTYIGYNTLSRIYTIDLFTDRGIAEHALGTFDGITWRWISEEKHVRLTMRIRTPNSFNYIVEVAPPGSSLFVTVSQSKWTRVSPSQ